MRLVNQSEASECGLACLATAASAFGLHIDLSEMRRRFGAAGRGTTLAQLIQYGQRLDFACRALRLELEDLGKLKIPAILHWDLNHFVVLSRVKTDKVTVLDPAVGERVLSLTEVSKHFTGVALELTPTVDFVPVDTRRRIRLADLLGKVAGLRRSMVQFLLIALALESFAIVAPLFNQLVIDEAIVSGDHELLLVLALGFLLLFAIQTAIGIARAWVIARFSTDLGLQWTANVFMRLIRLPLSWFEQRHLGDILSRFGSIGTIKQTVTGALLEAILDGVMAAAALAMMLIYSGHSR